MLSLKNLRPFALGGRRACYIHPENPNRCIKVHLPNKTPAILKSIDPWWKRTRKDTYYDENWLDWNSYQKLVKLHGQSGTEHVSSVYGFVDTDMGKGLQVALIRDPDGQISLSAKELILKHGLSEITLNAISTLEKFLLQQSLVLKDPFPHNIVIQRLSENLEKAYIVDGISRNPYIPKYYIQRKLIDTRIKKKCTRLRLGLLKTQQDKIRDKKPNSKGMLNFRN